MTVNVQSLTAFFKPASVAVVGASASLAKPSGRPVAALLKNGYRGKIFPVNPRYEELHGLRCYPTLESIPDPVDLAIVAVPAQHVLESLEYCGKKKVKAVIIITSGFAEIGEDGLEHQKQLKALAERYGMRICGPNTLGIISAPERLDASFAIASFPENLREPDFLGFITQSGGFGYGIYEMVRGLGLGFSHFISSGNEADVDFSEYIAYLVEDRHTKVIGGYLEGIRNGTRFLESARAALAAGKPIALIKAGRSEEAARAASTHTGSMVGSDDVYESVFRQYGIMRVESFHELSAMLTVLSGGKTPAGNRVGIVATSGGAGVYLTDKCAEYGLTLAGYSEETMNTLRKILPPFVAAGNPVDLTSFAMDKPGMLMDCCRTVANDPNVDILFICNFADERSAEHLRKKSKNDAMFPFTVEEIAEFAHSVEKPVLNLVWGHQESCRYLVSQLTAAGAPAVYEMEYGVRSMASLYKYHKKRQAFLAQKEDYLPFNPDKESVEKVVSQYGEATVLPEDAAKQVLAAYGIPTTRETVVKTLDEAKTAAREIGYPVALKLSSSDILHKTEAGALRLNLRSEQELEKAFHELSEVLAKNFPGARAGFLVQEMVDGGPELMIGINRDQVFGPTVVFGLGGVLVEALQDFSLRVAPVTPADAGEMLSEIKSKSLLGGYRNLPPVDKEELARLIAAVSQLAVDFPQIESLDINPLISSAKGIKAVDALITLKKETSGV